MKKVDDVFERMLIAGIPGGIERQEREGQQELIQSDELPKNAGRDGNFQKKDSAEIFANLGIEILGEVDELFYSVKLPTGWKKVATDHNMWSRLIDDKGRIRAGIFYKAAFYDRKARIDFDCRYKAKYIPEGGWDAPWTPDRLDYPIITDNDVEIWRGELTNKASTIAHAKLLEMFPNAEDIFAYWD